MNQLFAKLKQDYPSLILLSILKMYNAIKIPVQHTTDIERVPVYRDVGTYY